MYTHLHTHSERESLCRPEVSLQGYFGDLFRIRGFAPITGLISFFSRPLLLSSPLHNKFPANLPKPTSLFTIITILGSLGSTFQMYCFKSSYFLYSHTHKLCDKSPRLLSVLLAKCVMSQRAGRWWAHLPSVCSASLWPAVPGDIVRLRSRGGDSWRWKQERNRKSVKS